MTILILFGILALGGALAYLPIGERPVRALAVVSAVAALALVVWAAATAAIPEGAFGYASMLIWDETAAAGLVIVLVANALLAGFAYHALGREHLESSLGLMALRHRVAALAAVALGASLTVLADNVWLFVLGFAVMLGALHLAGGADKRRSSASLLLVVVLAISFIFVAEGVYETDLLRATFTALSSGITDGAPSGFFISGFLGGIVALGALVGLAPLGRVTWKRVAPDDAVLGGMFRAVVASAAMFGLLRFAYMGDVLWGADTIGPIFITLGLVTAALSVLSLLREPSDASFVDALLMLGAGLTIAALGIGPAGIIAALMFLGSRSVLAPLGIIALTLARARSGRSMDAFGLAAVAVPLSSAFVAYAITIGYGVQLRLITTLTLGILVAAATTLVVMRRAGADRRVETWQGIDRLAALFVALQGALLVAFLTPQSVQLAVAVLDRLATSL